VLKLDLQYTQFRRKYTDRDNHLLGISMSQSRPWATVEEVLAQLESHADSLDDLLTYSLMTLEEIKASAAALLALTKAMDKAHLERLSEICKRI